MLNFNNYPNLQSEGYTKTSDCTWDYNCIAWAVNKQDRWWWPFGKTPQGVEAYWPRKASKKVTLNAFESMFKLHHYKRTKNNSDAHEKGVEKVAIFVLNGKVTHAARQLEDGSWTHKIGARIDLQSTLKSVEGPLYGKVARIMQRKRS